VGTPERVARHRHARRKTAQSFLGILCLAATADWIKI
jgi:hypothetical protein